MDINGIINRIATFPPKIVRGEKVSSSLNRIINNQGMWLSNKQKNFFDVIVHKAPSKVDFSEFENGDSVKDEILKLSPNTCIGIVQEVGTHWVFYLDSFGVMQKADIVTFPNSNVVKGVNHTYERPAHAAKFVNDENDKWFKKNQSLITKAIDRLHGNKFLQKYLDDLMRHIKVSDRIMDVMKYELEKLDEGGRTNFPSTKPIKDTLKMKVNHIKEQPFNVILIGDVEGYLEVGYLSFNIAKLSVTLDLDVHDAGSANFVKEKIQEIKDSVLGGTVVIEGEFMKSSNYIIGSHMKLISLL